MKSSKHIPVMLNEAIDALNVRNNLNYIDVTFGAGGYSEAILKKANCRLLAIDKDPNVIGYAKRLKEQFKKRFSFENVDFSKLSEVLEKKMLVDGGIIADLGLSSLQLDNEKRGFSFMKNGPLDMRMNNTGMTAYDLINNEKELEIAKVLWEYGEERQSRAIAKLIVKERKISAIDTTFKLVNIIRKIKKNHQYRKKHPATKTFQALRIAINDELKALSTLLKTSERILLPGARLVIVTFHSLEDRIVKIFFNQMSGKYKNRNKHLPEVKENKKIKFKILNKKPLLPSLIEIEKNIRSRSAKLRVVEKIVI